MGLSYDEGFRAGERDYQSILIPTLSFGPLKIAEKLAYGQQEKLFKGEALNRKVITPDDPYYFYIEQGQICLYNRRETGEGTAIFWRNQGDAFSTEYGGFASIGKYPAQFIATKNTVLYGFSQRQLLAFAEADPEYFFEFVRVCHMTFAQIGHRVANVAHQAPDIRYAMWLQKLCTATNPNPDGSYSIPCNMTIRQLAELFMMHETTCTRLIAEFELHDLAYRRKRELYVPSVARLQQYTDGRTL